MRLTGDLGDELEARVLLEHHKSPPLGVRRDEHVHKRQGSVRTTRSNAAGGVRIVTSPRSGGR